MYKVMVYKKSIFSAIALIGMIIASYGANLDKKRRGEIIKLFF